jgi:hypothetical protein
MSDTRQEWSPAVPTAWSGRFDFWVATLTAAITAVTFVLAILTPPKGGPFCIGNCVGYPYTDISAYIPGDFLWMYPALLPAPLLVILLGGIQERAMAGRKRFANLAVAFGMMAATLLTADYFIQLRVIQPAVLKGEFEGLAPLTQYNPHGVFIALEEAGYLFMAVAFLFAALALSAPNRLYRTIRWVFAGGFTAAILLFLVLSFTHGQDVEYRFEVAAITVDWTVIIVVGALLAFAYRRVASEP